MRTESASTRAFLVVAAVFLLIIGAEVLAILRLNDGKFVYTLDDPYIHLALAENIWKGHYGVNLNEVSAPSSSILWPYLLAPLATVEYWPLVLNAVFGVLTIWILLRVLALTVRRESSGVFFFAGVGAALVVATNLVGLSLTGMEHVLQVLAVVLAGYGLALDARLDQLRPWLVPVAMFMPAIRYENLAVTAAVIAYLFLTGRRSLAAWTLLGAVVVITTFSVYLASMGLGYFPSSVAVKSDLVGESKKVVALLKNLYHSFNSRPGLLLAMIAFFIAMHRPKDGGPKTSALSWSLLVTLTLHLLLGRYGWYNRYEIYVLAFAIVLLMVMFLPEWQGLRNFSQVKHTLVLGAPLLIAGLPYIVGLATAPLASNNIFEQHYQMHRFVTSYLREPVAVNDLGYVAYKNDEYVLDLYGLGSEQARHLFRSQSNGDWMAALCRDHEVRVAMIYTSWFKSLPSSWVKLGELSLSRYNHTPAHPVVEIYATSEEHVGETLSRLSSFKESLPPRIVLSITPDVP